MKGHGTVAVPTIEKNLRCFYLNARSLTNKLDFFNLEIIENNNFPDIIFVTETWLDESFSNSLFECKNSYQIFRKDRTCGRGGGVAIFVKNEISCSPLEVPNIGSLEAIAVKIIFKNKCFVLDNCYKPHITDTHLLPYIDKFLSCLSKNNNSVLLTGDFNLPGIDWVLPSAPPIFDQSKFLDVFLKYGFYQIVRDATRYNNILDLIFTNEPHCTKNFVVLPPIANCDQNVLKFSLMYENENDSLCSAEAPQYLWSKMV